MICKWSNEQSSWKDPCPCKSRSLKNCRGHSHSMADSLCVKDATKTAANCWRRNGSQQGNKILTPKMIIFVLKVAGVHLWGCTELQNTVEVKTLNLLHRIAYPQKIDVGGLPQKCDSPIPSLSSHTWAQQFIVWDCPLYIIHV